MTCDFCLDGRHVRCRPTTNGCTCLRCAAERPKMPAVPKARREPKEGKPRREWANPWGSTGKVGKPLGWSTLPPDVQAEMEVALAAGTSLSELSRKYGVSRDKVRTIKRRMERANG